MTALEWERREPPLLPAAVIGRREAGRTLARRIAADPEPSRFRVAASDEWLLVLGDTDVLPWVPDARYLGWDHGLLLPTTHRPALPADLLSRAVRRHTGADLIVLMPDGIVTTVMPAHPVDPELLRALV